MSSYQTADKDKADPENPPTQDQESPYFPPSGAVQEPPPPYEDSYNQRQNQQQSEQPQYHTQKHEGSKAQVAPAPQTMPQQHQQQQGMPPQHQQPGVHPQQHPGWYGQHPGMQPGMHPGMQSPPPQQSHTTVVVTQRQDIPNHGLHCIVSQSRNYSILIHPNSYRLAFLVTT
eukprot:gb/GECG01001725.1/.p1 GENE.gb/GECG01001725.1/~~gb/GECG01001725.1/.p1  ORF type:complete len:172 (+),score=19.43 gb/GECG01001725.1/:1-516(+)